VYVFGTSLNITSLPRWLSKRKKKKISVKFIESNVLHCRCAKFVSSLIYVLKYIDIIGNELLFFPFFLLLFFFLLLSLLFLFSLLLFVLVL